MAVAAEERFWARVDSGDGCWKWTGSADRTGYGQISVKGKILRAHRFAWELTNGPVPEGRAVRQTCETRLCCRPDHLVLGGNIAPVADAIERAESTRLNRVAGKGHLERRGPSSFRLIAYNRANKDYERRSFRGTEEDAQVALAELVVELGVEGIAYETTVRTFGEELDAWLLVKKDEGLEESTLMTYENVLRRVDAKRRSLPVDKVTTAVLEALTRDLLAGKGPSGRKISRRQVMVTMALIDAALTDAKRHKRIRSNPALEVKLPSTKKDKATRRKPSPAPALGVRKVLELAEEKHGIDFVAFLAVVIALGGRRGEVIGLQWTRVDWERNRIELSANVVRAKRGWIIKPLPKDDESRFVDLGLITMGLLKQLHEDRLAKAQELGWTMTDEAFVFSDLPNGSEPWKPATALRRFQALCETAGLGRRRLQDLRAMMATELKNAGYSLTDISERLGHEDTASSVVALRHYIGGAPTLTKRAMADTLDEILYGGKPS